MPGSKLARPTPKRSKRPRASPRCMPCRSYERPIFFRKQATFHYLNWSLQREDHRNSGATWNQHDCWADLPRTWATSLHDLLTWIKEAVHCWRYERPIEWQLVTCTSSPASQTNKSGSERGPPALLYSGADRTGARPRGRWRHGGVPVPGMCLYIRLCSLLLPSKLEDILTFLNILSLIILHQF
jgi:hypothetical protein